MKTILLITLAALLSACGGAAGGGGASASATGSNPASNLHTYRMDVYGADPDFNFAPAVIGTNGNQTNPGPQAIAFGVTKSYTLVDTQADFQITGIGATNGAFFVTVTIFKDGTQMATGNIAVGVSQDFGTF